MSANAIHNLIGVARRPLPGDNGCRDFAKLTLMVLGIVSALVAIVGACAYFRVVELGLPGAGVLSGNSAFLTMCSGMGLFFVTLTATAIYSCVTQSHRGK